MKLREIVLHKLDGNEEKEFCVPEGLYLKMEKDHKDMEELRRRTLDKDSIDILMDWYEDIEL